MKNSIKPWQRKHWIQSFILPYCRNAMASEAFVSHSTIWTFRWTFPHPLLWIKLPSCKNQESVLKWSAACFWHCSFLSKEDKDFNKRDRGHLFSQFWTISIHIWHQDVVVVYWTAAELFFKKSSSHCKSEQHKETVMDEPSLVSKASLLLEFLKDFYCCCVFVHVSICVRAWKSWSTSK